MASTLNPAGELLEEAVVSDLVPAAAAAAETAVWSNKPLNGVDEESVSIQVMDVGIWPSLGDSTSKPALKSSSSESLQEVIGNSSSAAIVNDENTTTTTTATVNNVAPSVQRYAKRTGGSSGAYVSSNGIVTLRSQPSHEATHATSGKPVSVSVDFNLKDQKGSIRGNDQHYQRSSYRRGGNGGYHPRGGSDYGGKLDQGRGNQDWNRQRNVQQHRGGYVRPSAHNTPPVIPPIHMPMRPFATANNLIYSDPGSALFYFPGPAQHMVPGPMFFPFVDPVLYGKILNQINYYFSNENLVKDPFLRRSMDEQGWVSVNLIAGFKKVSSMTDDVQLILHVMRSSDLVEVQGDKMRRRNDWMRWLLPPVGQDSLVSHLQGVGLSSSRSSSSGELQQGGCRERAAVV